MEIPIKQMVNDETMYAVPWALYLKDGEYYLDGDDLCEPEPGGSLTMRIVRERDKFTVYMVDSDYAGYHRASKHSSSPLLVDHVVMQPSVQWISFVALCLAFVCIVSLFALLAGLVQIALRPLW